MAIRKEMNRTNSLIIFASITLGTFLLFNTTTMINVSALEDKELSYYSPEASLHNPDMYGEYDDNYEIEYYEDRYGKPYYIE
jgi:hypothetical protein